MRSQELLLVLTKQILGLNTKLQLPWRKATERKKLLEAMCLYLLFKKREINQRRFWVRPCFIESRRLLLGDSENLVVELRNEDEEMYINYFRMEPESFDELLALVEHRITKKLVIRTPISAKTRLEICLRYLATGDSMASVGFAFRVGKNTVSKIIDEVCEAIWEELQDKVFFEPTPERWIQKAADFKRLWDFPNCVSAIDGKHVTIQAPSNSGSTNYNYKGSHSIILMALSDANGIFTDVDIGAEGRWSDGGVLMNSYIGQQLHHGTYNLPPPTSIECGGPRLPYVILGDEAFGLNTYMMRPYSRKENLDLQKKVFNYRLSRARRTVECSFGLLAQRWRIYRKAIIASEKTAVKIVQATVCLHNFLLLKEIDAEDKPYSTLSAEDFDSEDIGGLRDLNNSEIIYNGAEVRDLFKKYFCTSGAIFFQWDKALNNDF